MHTIGNKPIMGMSHTAEHDQSFNSECPDLANAVLPSRLGRFCMTYTDKIFSLSYALNWAHTQHNTLNRAAPN